MPGVDPALTDEPRLLAMAARAYLRRTFLAAKVAISGANFAVAETGTLAVVESEGNGRMCLTLPRTLITVMGIEKLVPTLRDLEVFLQLLPRSSTGERMNPYTSLWTGVTPGRRPAGRARRAARQRPDRRPGRPASAAPALRCIRCSRLPERLPCVRAGRRSRLRLGLSRPDRRRPDAAARRHARPRRPRRHPAVRLVAVRGLLRRLPGQDRHPGAAGAAARPARRGGASAAAAADGGGGGHGGPPRGRCAPPAGSPRRSGPPGPAACFARGGRIRSLPPPLSVVARGWTASRDLPAPPERTFREWWAARSRQPPASGAPGGSER